MPAHAPITRQTHGRTFTVAGAALGLIALLQVGAVSWRFFQQPEGTGAGVPPQKIDIGKIGVDASTAEEAPLMVGKDPLQNDPVVMDDQGPRPVPVRPEVPIAVPLVKTPDASEAPVEPPPDAGPAIATPMGPARPTPIPLVQLTPKVDPQFTELIEQGKLLRNNGDTAGARVKFGQASSMNPGNAQAIAELAYTFEKMSLPDKAAEQWRRVLALGENAGALYSAARSKLDMAMQSARTSSPGTSGLAATVAEGKTLALGQPVMNQESAEGSARKFTLEVPIIARPGTPINRGDVKVMVLFYEQLNGKDLTNNSANVSYRWAAPPADWTEDRTEALLVSYNLPVQAGRPERRDYYGYIARLYYKGTLQTSLAEPAVLNQKFPAPMTLSE